MTGPGSPGIARALRSPMLLLVIPAAVVLLAAALTPAKELLAGNQGDVHLYFDNAAAIIAGRTPYSQVRLEYPPLALVPMLVPYLLVPGGPTFAQYAWLFAGFEAALAVALGFVLARIARGGGVLTRRRDPAWTVLLRYPLLVAGAALAIAWRFDLFAALLLAVALWATLADRPIAAGIALGLGVLAKLFPVVAAPVLAIAWLAPRDDGRVVRFGLAAGLTIVVGMLPFVAVAGGDAWSFLGYQSQRGLEIESIGAGFVLLDGLVRGQPVETASPFKAVEVFGPFARTWLGLLPALTAGGFGLLAAVAWRRVRLDLKELGRIAPDSLAALNGAAIMVLLVTSKVFSIQYVVWLVPFAPLLPGWRFWLGVGVVALTMLIHPLLFSDLVAGRAPAVLVLNLRNALLMTLTAAVLIQLWRVAGGKKPEPG